MTATESHRKALRARWRPDLRGFRSLRGTRSGSASPGRNSLGLYWSSGRCLLVYWLPWYRVSPAYLGGVARCPPPRPAGGESCGCGRSGRLITPQLTQCGVGCCRDSARNRHTRGRLPPDTVHINAGHCHSPPAEPPRRGNTANDIDPSTPVASDQPVRRVRPPNPVRPTNLLKVDAPNRRHLPTLVGATGFQ